MPQLVDQFRPDGTGRTGYQNHLIPNQAANLRVGQVDGISLEQFLNGHRRNLFGRKFPVHPLFQGRNHTDQHIAGQAILHNGLLASRFDVLDGYN